MPAVGNVRDAVMPEPPDTPAKSQDRDAMVPSESDDVVESALAVSPFADHVNAAVGGTFGGGGGGPPPMVVAVRSS